MLINYCDLCSQPLKENNFHTLYSSSPENPPPDPKKYEDINDYYSAYERYIKYVEKEIKQICPTCKSIMDKIFELRLQNLNKVTEEIINTYNFSPRKKEIK